MRWGAFRPINTLQWTGWTAVVHTPWNSHWWVVISALAAERGRSAAWQQPAVARELLGESVID